MAEDILEHEAGAETERHIQRIAAEEQREAEERRAAGRYRLDELATVLGVATNTRADSWLKVMVEDVKAGKLCRCDPLAGVELQYTSPIVREWYDQVTQRAAHEWLSGKPGYDPEWLPPADEEAAAPEEIAPDTRKTAFWGYVVPLWESMGRPENRAMYQRLKSHEGKEGSPIAKCYATCIQWHDKDGKIHELKEKSFGTYLSALRKNTVKT